MKVDTGTHYQMRLWCIENISTKNSYRQWRFEYPKDQKHGDPYEFTPFFDRKEDKVAFKEKWRDETNGR